ncbi:FRG domain-containing protein [Christensenellaceae bacterium OttesenSCG-928-M15]|nr:FRG domain-containing protein [Christensenellaceae bacterium OttesenSCG-928-M15]
MHQSAVTIKSLHQYIGIVDELSKSYRLSNFIENPTAPKFIFRGVGNSTYPLLPNIFRKINPEVDGGFDHQKQYAQWAKESDILKDFIQEASAIIRDTPKSEMSHWNEYAQHYGVPTRFLDWTSNPLVALHFACCAKGKDNPAVWILHVNNYTSFSKAKNFENSELASGNSMKLFEIFNFLIEGKKVVDYPIVYRPYYVDQRMGAQSSCFMVWGNKTDALENMTPDENWMRLTNKKEDGSREFGREQKTDFLLKLEIHEYAKPEILRQLDLMEINEKRLFPGLDGIGKYIERKYRFNNYEVNYPS